MPSTNNPAPDRNQQLLLLQVARESVEHGLQHGRRRRIEAADFPEILQAERATFVTLKNNTDLRGCIGTTSAVSSLVTSVNDNAYTAAFHDPRFHPLQQHELADIYFSISVLTPSQPLEFTTEIDLLEQLRIGIDGLTIMKADKRATFLPAVWDSLPDKNSFIQHLKNKAGMRPGDVPERAWIYQSIQFGE